MNFRIRTVNMTIYVKYTKIPPVLIHKWDYNLLKNLKTNQKEQLSLIN